MRFGSDGDVAIVALCNEWVTDDMNAPAGFVLNSTLRFAHSGHRHSASRPDAMSERLDWVFFDCFDTLLAEPRSGERFPYLTPLADLPVRYGLYGARAEFLADYARWYESRWPEADATPTSGRDWAEVPLAARLTELFAQRREHMPPESDRSMETGAAQPEEIVPRMISRLCDHYLRTLTPTDGVGDMLSQLHGRVKTAVVSNFYIAGWPALALDHFGLAHRFEFVLDSAAFGVKKPGREIYGEALRRAAVRPGNALFVGDSPTSDVLAPRRLGMQALHYRPVTRNAGAGIGAATLRDGVISHWRDLPAVLSLGT